jgi:hypothetical protein
MNTAAHGRHLSSAFGAGVRKSRATAGSGRSARVRRARPATFKWIVLWIGTVSVFGIAYVAETAAATQASFQIATLKQQQSDMRGQQQQIRYQISLATSAGQIDGDAAKLGMVRPDPQSNGNANRSWLDQLALALGRPTEAQAKGR